MLIIGFTALLPLANEATGGALSNPLGSITNVFADTPDHDPAKLRAWAQQVAATGEGICQGQFNLAEAIQAVRYAPEGREGDSVDAASQRGLYTAIYLPMLNDGSKAVDVRPFLTSPDAIARLAVGVAHGRLDCAVGWQEQPAVEHLSRIISRYRNRPPGATVPSPAVAAVEQAGAQVSEALEGTGVSPLQLGLGALSVFLLLQGR